MCTFNFVHDIPIPRVFIVEYSKLHILCDLRVLFHAWGEGISQHDTHLSRTLARYMYVCCNKTPPDMRTPPVVIEIIKLGSLE